MRKIIVYTRENCSYCEMAKSLLKRRSLAYTVVDLTHDHDLREQLAAPHHWRTLPMIFIDDKFIGGYTDLAKLDGEGALKPLD